GFLSVRTATEHQNCLCQWTGDRDFIMDRIVCQIVHGPADQRFLSSESASGRSVFLRQPGECRNLRMVHSVWYQQFVALAIVSDRLRLTEVQSDSVQWCAADGANGGDVAIRREGVARRRRVTEVGNPHFFVLQIESHTGGVS